MVNWFFVSVFAFAVADARCFWKAGQPVKTITGTVLGQESARRSLVSEYLGIPFAKPPVGDLRWAAPVPLDSTRKVIKAKQYVGLDSFIGQRALKLTLRNQGPYVKLLPTFPKY